MTSDVMAYSTKCVITVGKKPEAGSSGFSPPQKLREVPSPDRGLLAGFGAYGKVPFGVCAKPLPSSRAP